MTQSAAQNIDTKCKKELRPVQEEKESMFMSAVGYAAPSQSNQRMKFKFLTYCERSAFFISRLFMPTVSKLVSWCFEPSQPLMITSGLKTNFSPSLTYSADKSLNVNHDFPTTQLKCFT